ncbi:helix-turn-helix domain-containing protein [Polynucleobacter paneuropaeus]|uniref:helix-turn-helix domain-containing protein n=1 Tax=Polynucleobacter paneuropaeus TaxID=2527775 RepID=UPI001CEF79C5|nr:helix-turn-helix domain-containing protein [Polynucleobacter paneuropaeus]
MSIINSQAKANSVSIILFKQVKLIDLREYRVKNPTQCKYLLEVLADIAQEKNGNLCIPQQTTVAKRMNSHPKTVHRWAKELAKAKIIFINQRIGTSNSYIFNPEIFQIGENMYNPQSNHTPTIITHTSSPAQSDIAPYPEQPSSTPEINGTPLTLIDLNNTYFKTLKKDNHRKYIDEISAIGKELGFSHPMPEGELEIAIKKYYEKPKTQEEIGLDKQKAINALRNYGFNRVR